MNLQELYDLLEIEHSSEFQYFENFADIIETDEEIPYETLYLLVKELDYSILSELINEYFEELQNGIPDEETDMYLLLNNIGLSLAGMSKNMEEDEDIVLFTEELDKFKRYYTAESKVLIRKKGSNDVFKEVSLSEALTISRMEKLTKEYYEYDFSNALEYELTDYVMSFKDIIEPQDEVYDGELQDGYVYDDEFNDEF